MKVESKKFRFSQLISRGFVLGVVLSILVSPWNAIAASQGDELISCGEFISMMAKHQPENKIFPKDFASYSKEDLYSQTVQNMSGQGYHVLDNKSFNDPLEANEFVQVSYAFANGPLGKNLFEQKLFLKQEGIVDSADVGLTTAYDGKVYQTHFEDNVVKPVHLATPVYMNDRIKTDLLSKATFTFDDKSTLTLAEDSVVNITKHIYDPEKDLRQTIVHLSRGTVRFVVTKGKAQGSMFKVVTPTAIAGVRGTEFVVDVAPDGKTTFLVLEGQIETKPFVPGAKETRFSYISAGESQSVSKNGVATGVTKAPPGLLRAAAVKTAPPGLTMANKGLSKKMVRGKVQKLALANKVKMGKGAKAKVLKVKVLKKGIKAKVLKMANNSALFDAKTLGKRFKKIRGNKTSKLIPNGSGKFDAKANAQANARANAKANAQANARANAKANAQANAKSTAKANAQAAAKANARQVAQERGIGQSMKCMKTGKC